MANKIQFTIDSVFNGEGFQRADNAVRGAANTAATAATNFRQVGAALGQLPGTAGKVAQAVGGVVNAFKTMGPIGGIVAIAQIAINKWAGSAKAAADKVAKAAQDAATAMKDKSQKIMQGFLSGVTDMLDKVGAKADASNKSLNNMADILAKINAATGKTESAKESADVVQLKLDNLRKVAEAETENAKALAEVEGNLAVTLLERKNANDEAARNLKAAEDNQKEMDRRMAVADRNLEEAKAAEAKAKEDLAHWDIEAMQGTKELEAAKKAMADAEALLTRRYDEWHKASGDSQIATEELTQAFYKQKQTEDEHEMKVMEATQKLDELKASQEADKKAHEKAAEIREEIVKAEEKYAAAIAEKEALISTEKARREMAVERLAKAQEDSAQWELDKVEAEQYHYTKMQQVNMEHLRNSVNLNEKQKEALAKYDKWLRTQGMNPFKEMITNVTAEIQKVDKELKDGVIDMDQQIKDLGTNLKDLNDSLTGCIKMK